MGKTVSAKANEAGMPPTCMFFLAILFGYLIQIRRPWLTPIYCLRPNPLTFFYHEKNLTLPHLVHRLVAPAQQCHPSACVALGQSATKPKHVHTAPLTCFAGARSKQRAAFSRRTEALGHAQLARPQPLLWRRCTTSHKKVNKRSTTTQRRPFRHAVDHRQPLSVQAMPQDVPLKFQLEAPRKAPLRHQKPCVPLLWEAF